jgi:GPH family glycoside/pentoside/hexuronide:cation symporter
MAENSATKTEARTDKLRLRDMLAYGTGDLGMSVAWSFLGGYTTFFLTNAMKLSPAVVGMIILISRVFDGFSDIIMGVLVDRTRTKIGKARPWMLRAAIPLGIAFGLFFFVPPFGTTGKIIWVFITYNLVSTVCFTAASIPYAALSPLMTRDAGSRLGLNVTRMLCAILSGLIAASISMPVINALGGDGEPKAWFALATGYAVFMTIMILLCAALTKERYSGDETKTDNVPFKKALGGLLKNKYWAIMTVCMVLYFVLQNISSGVNIYYFTYVLHNNNAMGLAAISMSLPLLIGIGLSPMLAKKFGKGNLARFSAFAGMFAPLIAAINPENMIIILLKAALSGLIMAPFASVGFAMIADVCDYGYWKTGIRAEGLINSACGFGTKVGAGLGSAAVSWILAFSGFNESLGEFGQTPGVIFSMKFMIIGLPIIICALQFAFLWFYKLDKQYPHIMAELEARESEKSGVAGS